MSHARPSPFRLHKPSNATPTPPVPSLSQTLAVLPAAGAGHAIAAMLLRRRVSCTADATCLVTRGPTMAELQLAEARELGCLALVVAGWLGVAYASQVLGCCGMRVRAAELARRKLL